MIVTLCVGFCGLPHSFQVVYTNYVRETERSIVEEHYERYMDQEEEYEREHYGIESDSSLH